MKATTNQWLVLGVLVFALGVDMSGADAWGVLCALVVFAGIVIIGAALGESLS